MTQPKIESRIRSVLSPSARHRGMTSVHALVALSAIVLSASALASMRFGPQDPAQLPAGARPTEEEQTALKRAKMLSTATMIYSQDYDDRFPNAEITKGVQKARAEAVAIAKVRINIMPYLRNADILKSPTARGEFLYNLNVAGVNLIDIDEPAKIPLWYEKLPIDTRIAVGYVDGHAAFQKATDREFQKVLQKSFFRRMSQPPNRNDPPR